MVIRFVWPEMREGNHERRMVNGGIEKTIKKNKLERERGERERGGFSKESVKLFPTRRS